MKRHVQMRHPGVDPLGGRRHAGSAQRFGDLGRHEEREVERHASPACPRRRVATNQPLERRPLDELRDDRGMVPPDERHLVRLHRVRVHDIGGTLRRATESDERRVWLVVRGEVVDLHRDWPADERIGLEDPAVGGRRSAATELADERHVPPSGERDCLVERRREGGRSGHPGPRSPIATTEPSPSTLGAVEYRRTFECGGKASDLPWGPIDPRLRSRRRPRPLCGRVRPTRAGVLRHCASGPPRLCSAPP